MRCISGHHQYSVISQASKDRGEALSFESLILSLFIFFSHPPLQMGINSELVHSTLHCEMKSFVGNSSLGCRLPSKAHLKRSVQSTVDTSQQAASNQKNISTPESAAPNPHCTLLRTEEETKLGIIAGKHIVKYSQITDKALLHRQLTLDSTGEEVKSRGM